MAVLWNLFPDISGKVSIFRVPIYLGMKDVKRCIII